MYSKMALLAAVRVDQLCRYRRSSLSVEKKLSATGRLRPERMPWLSTTVVYASDLYWQPRSVWWIRVPVVLTGSPWRRQSRPQVAMRKLNEDWHV